MSIDSLASFLRDIGKQCRPRAAERGVRSDTPLFAFIVSLWKIPPWIRMGQYIRHKWVNIVEQDAFYSGWAFILFHALSIE